MGTILDTTVFIELERAMAEISRRLEAQLGTGEEVGIAAITASELLHGVHRATEEHRGWREAFIEGVLAAFPVLAFDLRVDRVHAKLWAALASSGVKCRRSRPACRCHRPVRRLADRNRQRPPLHPLSDLEVVSVRMA
jgi:predicted nucleic acid-binding protein